MKLYKICSGGSVDIVSFVEGDPPLVLGERGRGRDEVIIPVVGGGNNFRVAKTGHGIVLFADDREEPDNGRCLAIINTVGGYSRSRSYNLFDAVLLTELARGFIAFGDAGRVNGGPELLAICDAGAQFRLNSKYSSTWFRWTGAEWIVESTAERAARLARERFARGEVEWL